jgi:nucleoside transporter
MAMMFLMFFSWGAWYGQMSEYLRKTLHADYVQIGNAYSTLAIASILAPFFIGLIADRFFSAQKVMGVLNLLGAIILYFLCKESDPNIFFWYILGYLITFAPNLSLSNTIAMNQMSDPSKEFSAIRVTGTISFLIAVFLIGYLKIGSTVAIFQVPMLSSFILGLYSFYLPDTPPKANKNATLSQIIGLDALQLFKDRTYVIFFISSILICIPLSFYYAMANPSLKDAHMNNVEMKMSLGQASEIIFMLLIPFAFTRLGVKKMLIVGLIAWIIRFVCFGYGDGLSSEWILYIGIILHGVCYDFFFVTGQIYTDQKAGEKIKNSAQGLLTLATYGIGMGIGSTLSGITREYFTSWTAFWMVPAGIAALVLVLFILFFHEKKQAA